jgi:sterol 14-demethylase
LQQAFFDKWGDEGEVDLLQQLSDLIILTASRCLMGKEVREQLFDKVSELFHHLDMGMLPISLVFPYLPIPAHRKRDWARAELSKIFSKIINNRRDSGQSEPDVLQVCKIMRNNHLYLYTILYSCISVRSCIPYCTSWCMLSPAWINS